MSLKWYSAYQDELDKDPDSRPRSRKAAYIKARNRQMEEASALVESADNSAAGFNPSFTGSKHERAWIQTYLGPFYDDNMILDVLRQVKGGKEATVYCCAADPSTGVELIAAKVYRPREFRNLRNDSLYRQGRGARDEQGKTERDRRSQLALTKGTRFGQEMRHASWLYNEYEALTVLHAAGADVPRPFAYNENAILMEYIGGPDGPAPALGAVHLPPYVAQGVFERVMRNIEIMLAHDRIHADLSAHNILYWEGKITIIDFPQAVNPLVNPAAYDLLYRDVERVTQYFARQGITADPVAITARLWKQYVLTGDE